MTEKYKYYRHAMFMYGILSILYVLQYFEEQENYEECKAIIDTIKGEEERLGCKLFTVINKKTVQDVIDVYKKFNLTGKNVIENSQYYSDIIIKEIISSPTKSSR
jgi:hypothetical protein